MRVRSIFPAGLRHRSLAVAWLGRANSYHIFRKSAILRQYKLCNPCRSSNDGYSVLFQRSPVGTPLFPPYRCGLSLSSAYRTFYSSSAPRIKISLDDLDEAHEFADLDDLDQHSTDSSVNISRDLGTMVRNRQAGSTSRRPPPTKEALRTQMMALAGRRSPALSETQQIERLRRGYHRIESALSTITSLDALVSEYCLLKYALFEDELSKCARSIEDWELEYRQIKYAELPMIESRVSMAIESISTFTREFRRAKHALQVSALELKISSFAVSFNELVHEFEELIRPRISARKNVNRLLETGVSLQEYYHQLKESFRPAEHNLMLIHRDIYMLKRDGKYLSHAERVLWDQHYLDMGIMIAKTFEESHRFRAYHLRRKTMEGPFARAWYPHLLRTYAMSKDTKSEARRASLEALISPHNAGQTRSEAGHAIPWTYTKLLQRFYLRRLGKPQPPRSPELNIYWRQLDVLAPIELVLRSATVLSMEILYLLTTLRSIYTGLWSNLSLETRRRFLDKTRKLFGRFQDHRLELIREHQMLVNINWLRLQTEHKLYALGEPDVSQERGLFIAPKCLSQDIRSFHQWTQKMAANEAAILLLARATSNISPFKAADGDPLVFEEQRQTYSDIILDLKNDYSLSTRGSASKDRSENSKRLPAPEPPITNQTFRKVKGTPFWDALSDSQTKSRVENRDRVYSVRREERDDRVQSSYLGPSHLSRKGASRKDPQNANEKVWPGEKVWTPLVPPSTKASPASISRKASKSGQPSLTMKLAKSSGYNQRTSKRNKKDVTRDPSTKPRKRSLLGKDFQSTAGSRPVADESLSLTVSTPETQGLLKPKSSEVDRLEDVVDMELFGRPLNAARDRPGKLSEQSPRAARYRRTNSPREGSKEISSASAATFRPKQRPNSNPRPSRPGKFGAGHKFGDSKRSYSSFPAVQILTEDGNESEYSSDAPAGSSCEYTTDPDREHYGNDATTLAGQEVVDARKASQDHFPSEVPVSSETDAQPTRFWSHNLRKGPGGKNIVVHYCRSLERTEQVARYFLDSAVVGFDIEWKAQASSSDSIQNNLSLIQLANEERIALFQIALFRPAKTLGDLVAPSLKKLMESSDVTKVGVSIKADSTRLRKYLGINARGLFELSYLYKLVKYSQSDPKMVNRRAVNLSLQVEEHLGLPLDKDDDVRRSDWTRTLDYRQVQYAAADPYACLCLFNVMEAKRKALDPVPPRPAHAELDLPILLASGLAVSEEALEPEETPVTNSGSHDPFNHAIREEEGST